MKTLQVGTPMVFDGKDTRVSYVGNRYFKTYLTGESRFSLETFKCEKFTDIHYNKSINYKR